MKTVLVLDKMPEMCGYCPCSSFNPQANRWECSAELLCRERYATVKVVDEHTRPSWCRLKPLPQPKDCRKPPANVMEMGKRKRDYTLHKVDVENAEINGWNDCLEEITNADS